MDTCTALHSRMANKASFEPARRLQPCIVYVAAWYPASSFGLPKTRVLFRHGDSFRFKPTLLGMPAACLQQTASMISPKKHMNEP